VGLFLGYKFLNPKPMDLFFLGGGWGGGGELRLLGDACQAEFRPAYGFLKVQTSLWILKIS
jgi:hypothetical protein